MFIDLSDEVIHHCMMCADKDTSKCKTCFFGTLDIGQDDFGGAFIYKRAYRYLRILRQYGYCRNDTFGTTNILEGITVKK